MNEQEERLIRRYCLYSVAAKAFLAVALLIGALWGLLVMINDMVFNGDFYFWGLVVYIGIVAAYVIAFIICFYIPHLGMQKDSWQQIVRKAEDVIEALPVMGPPVTPSELTNALNRDARLAADICGVRIPKARKYVLPIVLLPVILLIAVYIPQYISSKQETDQQIAIASRSVYELQASLEKGCDHVNMSDPKEGYRSGGYQVTGYLYSYDEPFSSYINVTVENDGVISEVDYCIGIDIQADKEENLTKAETDIRKLNAMLKDSNVKALSAELLEECTLPEEFKTQFQESSYYEGFLYRKNETISVNYMTDPEEEYDEYSESDIYFSIEG